MVHGNTWKSGDQCPCYTKRTGNFTKRDTPYSWTWRHNVALTDSVGTALPKALWHWCFETWGKRNGWASGGLHLKHENHEFLMFLFSARRSKLTHRAGKTHFFTVNLSHMPANRNGCPCCKHVWTSPTNTSFLSLNLENFNFKFVTLTRAASQPVALFFPSLCQITRGYKITGKQAYQTINLTFYIIHRCQYQVDLTCNCKILHGNMERWISIRFLFEYEKC